MQGIEWSDGALGSRTGGLRGGCWALHQGAHGHRPRSGVEEREGEISKNRKGKSVLLEGERKDLQSITEFTFVFRAPCERPTGMQYKS